MKFHSKLAMALAALCLPLSAQEQMAYQGRLTDNQGLSLTDASKKITFSIYSAPTGGTALWGPLTINAALVDGRFGVKLGPTDSSSRDISAALSGTDARYMEVEVVSDEGVSDSGPLPRQQILPAARALSAERAAILQDGTKFKASIQAQRTIGSNAGNSPFNFNTAQGLLLETGFAEGSGLFLNGNTAAIYSPGNGGSILSVYDEDSFDGSSETDPTPAFSVKNGGGFTADGSSTITSFDSTFQSDATLTMAGAEITSTSSSLNLRSEGSILLGTTNGNQLVGVNGVIGNNVTMSVIAPSSNTYFEVRSNPGLFTRMRMNQTGLLISGTATKTSSGSSWISTSDGRLKKDISKYEHGLQEVLNLETIRFRYKNNEERGLSDVAENIGFVAQDVQKLIPEAVIEGDDGYLSLDVDPIHWAAINAIQELNDKIEGQSKTITTVTAENASLKERLDAMEARLNEVVTTVAAKSAVETASASQ